MMKLLRKLRAFYRRDKVDGEMAEEMRVHLDLQAAENERRGLSAEEFREGLQSLTGVGVMPAGFNGFNPGVRPDLWWPIQLWSQLEAARQEAGASKFGDPLTAEGWEWAFGFTRSRESSSTE